MFNVIRAELRKLRRPTLFLGTMGAVVFFSGLFSALLYLLIDSPQGNADRGQVISREVLALASGGVQGFASVGGFLGIIALCVFAAQTAQEYTYGTLRNLLVRQPSRMKILAGKLISMKIFALAMIVSRLLGDKTLDRLGPALTVKLGAYIGGVAWGATILIAVPLSESHPLLALIIINLGFIAVGFGIGPMFPAFILAASRLKGIAPAVAISRVGVIGIAGFFIGPTITGLIAEVTSLSWAMAYPVAMMILAGYMSKSINED